MRRRKGMGDYHGGDGDVVRELGELFQSGTRLHAIVGAGLSASMGMPDWENLFEEISPTPRVVSGVALAGDRTRDERARADLPWRAQLIEMDKRIGKAGLREHIRKRFLRDRVDPGPALASVVRLPFQHILTTNYDNLLDLTHALLRSEQPMEVLRWEVAEQRSQFMESLGREATTRFYFHLHGRADLPEHCIVTEEDYRDRYIRSHATSRDLYTLFASQTVVFIGFSLKDPDFTAILREAQALASDAQPRYAILPRPAEGEAGLTAYLLGKYGVMPILYANHSKKHEGLAAILADLELLAAGTEPDWAFVNLTLPRPDGRAPVEDDDNAGHFGGLAERDGHRLALKDSVAWSDGWCTLRLAVSRLDGGPITERVAFYLHSSFPESVIRVVPVDGSVTLELHARGAFTVGAVVGRQRILLELDLAGDESLPAEFRGR